MFMTSVVILSVMYFLIIRLLHVVDLTASQSFLNGRR